MSKLFNVNWEDVKSALISGLIMAVLVIGIEILNAGSVFNLDWKTILNSSIIAFITVIVSFLKSLLTTDTGKFVGLTKIK